MSTLARVFQATEAARFDGEPLSNVPLFEFEDLAGCLLGFRPGQILPRHRHAHEHEVFDVLAGAGTVWLEGERVRAGPGSVIWVPAGVEHGFENDGAEEWVIRATIHTRTYLRTAVKRALLKRLGRAEW